MPGIRSSLYSVDHRQRGFTERSVPYQRPGVHGLGALPVLSTLRIQPVVTDALRVAIAPTLAPPTPAPTPSTSSAPRTSSSSGTMSTSSTLAAAMQTAAAGATTTPQPVVPPAPTGTTPTAVSQSIAATGGAVSSAAATAAAQEPEIAQTLLPQAQAQLEAAAQAADTTVAEVQRSGPMTGILIGIAGAVLGYALLRVVF